MGALRTGRLVAITLFGVYFALLVFGFVDIDRGDAPGLSREAFWGLVIGVPCFVVGAAIGRWWAPAVGLFFVAFMALGERCVDSRVDGVIAVDCSGVQGADLMLLVGVTSPCVLAGVIAVKLATAVLAHTPREGPSATVG